MEVKTKANTEANSVDKVKMLEDNELILNVISNFVNSCWFAPQDCLLRSTETLIWAKRHFTPPVLDIGTGDGRNSRFMFAYNQKIDVGIDVDFEAQKDAYKSGVYKKVQVEDASGTSFSDETFNTVISHSTFEHIKKDIIAVKEVARILKNNGLFYFTVPIPEHQKILKEAGVGENELKKYNKRVKQYRYRSVEEWKNILEKNNLEVVFQKTYFSKDVHLLWYKLHKIATYKPYRRELWSYLKDSPYGKLFPSFVVKPLLRKLISSNIQKAYNGEGVWLFTVAKKKV